MAIDNETLGAALGIMRANPAYEQTIIEAVEAWLDDHPEEASSNYSITVSGNKLVIALRASN